jgi:hypothetical protein
MDANHEQYLATRHRTSEWRGRSDGDRRTIAGFNFSGSELPGWSLLGAQRDERQIPVEIKSFWYRGDPTNELLSINVWEAVSVATAHDQLLEVVANIQSGSLERSEGDDRVGDVMFAGETPNGITLALFARVNVVVLVRNAERRVVNVEPVARELDRLLLRLSEA